MSETFPQASSPIAGKESPTRVWLEFFRKLFSRMAAAETADSAHAALTTTAHGGIVASTDSRLTDARTPTAHKASHISGTDQLDDVTTSVHGLMTAADKTKLDGMPKAPTRQVLTSSSGTWTRPTGCLAIRVRNWAGGGAGGGAPAAGANQSSVGGGGGSGGYAESLISSPSASYSYACGAGGTGNSGAAGGDGGDTTFNTTTVVAKGGKGGQSSGVAAAAAKVVTAAGGNGGLVGTGQISGSNVAGYPGIGTWDTSGSHGGRGGGSLVGRGGNGATSAANGGDATGYSGGGGGALDYVDSTARTGGAGAPGIIIVEEYY